MIIDATQRWARVAELRGVLENSASGSSTQLAGSLASGNFDAFSDIDLQWRVGSAAAEVMGHIGRILSRSIPWLRFVWTRTRTGHLIADFVRPFGGWPLFWWVDLDVEGDFSGVNAAGTWSVEESALMNGIGGLKALYRGQADRAADLLSCGFDRNGAVDPGGPPLVRVMANSFHRGPGATSCRRRRPDSGDHPHTEALRPSS